MSFMSLMSITRWVIKWMQKGETAKSGKYREFFEAITRAEYEAEVRMVALWQKHMPEDYRKNTRMRVKRQ